MRNTKQKDLILKIINNSCTHPNANEVYESARLEIPNISLGTVYRNLNAMADEGRILRLDVGDGVVHFDANVEPHLHMLCSDCKSIIDLDVEYETVEPYIKEIQKLTSHKIDSAEILFKGQCFICQKKNS